MISLRPFSSSIHCWIVRNAIVLDSKLLPTNLTKKDSSQLLKQSKELLLFFLRRLVVVVLELGKGPFLHVLQLGVAPLFALVGFFLLEERPLAVLFLDLGVGRFVPAGVSRFHALNDLVEDAVQCRRRRRRRWRRRVDSSCAGFLPCLKCRDGVRCEGDRCGHNQEGEVFHHCCVHVLVFVFERFEFFFLLLWVAVVTQSNTVCCARSNKRDRQRSENE
mmetsp:Transcript_28502/g.61090  ORF Transcript_28502/g.61090 Transcript_28502/m.61090 type:complete len:219 (+) Transcript_28502:215-871(+)